MANTGRTARLSVKTGLAALILYAVASMALMGVVHWEMRRHALDQAAEKARLILRQTHAVNAYFLEDLRPQLFDLMKQYGVPDTYFNPVWMSAGHAQRLLFSYFQEGEFKDFYYKNAAVNARSEANEADDLEARFLTQARAAADPTGLEWSGVRDFDGQPFFVLMRPNLQRFDQFCMRCHDTPDLSPAQMLTIYGDQRGFNKQLGDIPSVFSLRVPLRSALAQVNEMTWQMGGLLSLLFLAAYGAMWWVNRRMVVIPLRRMREQALAVAEDESLLGQEVEPGGARELDDLAGALNSMSARLKAGREQLEQMVENRTTQLRASQDSYRFLADNVADVIWRMDEHGRFAYFSPSVQKLLGFTPQEALELTLERLVPPDELSQAREIMSQCPPREGEAGDGDLVRVWRFNHLRKDGGQIPVETTTQPMRRPDGAYAGIIGVMRDITERVEAERALRESEERLRDMFDNAPLGYQSLDVNGNFLEVNNTWLESLGYERQEVLGRNFADFLAPEWRGHFEENFPRFKAAGEIMGVEFELLRKDGGRVLVSFRGKVGLDRDGNFRQTHCVFQDITDQRRTEMEQERLERQLRQAQKLEALGTLAGGVAHEFNNILTAITGYTELAQEANRQGMGCGEELSQVLYAATRASDLVRRILSFTHKSEAPMRSLDFNQTVQEALKLITPTLPRMVEVVTELAPDLPNLRGNPTQIGQILMNLCANAQYVMPDGGRITVATGLVDLDGVRCLCGQRISGQWLRLTITDNGWGMDAATREKAFDPFFTTKEVGQGTGLGLSTVFGLVKAHGGHLTCYSEPGQGTVFSIYLSPEEGADQTQPVAQAALAEPPGGREAILVVDDEPALLELSMRMLSRQGYQVSSAASGEEALEKLAGPNPKPDLVILDISMPGMGGERCLRELDIGDGGMKVIIASGYGRRGHLGPDLAQKVSAYLTKPFDRRQMLTVVRQVLDGS